MLKAIELLLKVLATIIAVVCLILCLLIALILWNDDFIDYSLEIIDDIW